MSDHSASDGESPEESKLRISLRLAPSVRTDRDALELPSEPMAVPASIRKRGLSAVVNHLLDRRVPKDDGDSDSDSGSESDDEDKLPALPFDFLLNDKLLRLPLEAAARKEGLSTEHALEDAHPPIGAGSLHAPVCKSLGSSPVKDHFQTKLIDQGASWCIVAPNRL